MEVVLAFVKSYWLHAIAACVGAWIAWTVQGVRVDGVKTEFAGYKTQVAQQAIEARQAALKQKEQWIKEKEDAEQRAAQREATLRAERDRALAGARRLRDDIAALRERLSTDTGEACRRYVGTLSDVLGECSERYSAVAGVADQCVSDVATLSEAWPQ